MVELFFRMLDWQTQVQVMPHSWVYTLEDVLFHQKHDWERPEGSHHVKVFVDVHVYTV